ncbi:phage holin family protein [Paenibacillus sp. KS-LC4]|uniref:phage holin family protein n=1 Tax=Paenibacillus sp. KS-LC4 TaxID=2979727 RepID=UPI0030D5AB9E
MFKQIFSVDLTPDKAIFTAIGAFLAPWVALIYGTDRFIPIVLLITAISLDWITGIAAAHKDGTYSSDYGLRRGAPRTLFLLVLPALANLIDLALNMPGPFFYAITIGLIYHSWQSLTANAFRAGWGKWIPAAILKLIESELKAKVDRTAQREGDDTDANIESGKE